MDLNPFEHAMNGIGIGAGKLFGFFSACKLQDHKAARLVRQGTGKQDAPFFIQTLQVGQMGWSVDGSFRLSLRTIIADNDEGHIASALLMLNTYTLGLLRMVEQWLNICDRRSVVILDGAAIFVAGCQFVPPPDFFLAEFPAQIDDSTVSDMWKIAQPEVDVFDDDSQLMDGAEACADVLKTSDVMNPDRRTASMGCIGRSLLDFLMSSKEHGFSPLDGREMGLKLWDQPVGFGKRKKLLRAMVVV